MKRIISFLLVLTMMFAIPVMAQADQVFVGRQLSVPATGYSVTVYWHEGDEPDDSLLTDISDLVFKAYPAMRETYGTNDLKDVKIFLWDESAMPENVPAYANSDGVNCSRQFLEADRGNLNCIVHELFHVVQNTYPQAQDDALAAVLCEGLADVARYEYSVYEDPAWSLTPYSEGQSYMDSYTVTAAFLVWINETYDEDFCLRLNRVLHEGTYSDYFWVDLTGSTLDELWATYTAQPR